MFLVNGVRLSGCIEQADASTLILVRDGKKQAIYRHAVATIVPVGHFSKDAFDSGEYEDPKNGESLLNSLVKVNDNINAYMLNGIRLSGILLCEDDEMILMSVPGKEQFQAVMKRAIATLAALD
ncbi:RNA-binding protein Hfq [compost metagenome]